MGDVFVLHSDKARSHKAIFPRVLHDAVRHSKKKVKVKGTWILKKPVYTKVWYHKLPDGKTLKVKAGTQIIDRAWRFIRSHLTGISARPGSVRLEAAVRSAQWLYWNRNADLWVKTGEMLKANRR